MYIKVFDIAMTRKKILFLFFRPAAGLRIPTIQKSHHY